MDSYVSHGSKCKVPGSPFSEIRTAILASDCGVFITFGPPVVLYLDDDSDVGSSKKTNPECFEALCHIPSSLAQCRTGQCLARIRTATPATPELEHREQCY